jgi:hypothetical protein
LRRFEVRLPKTIFCRARPWAAVAESAISPASAAAALDEFEFD